MNKTVFEEGVEKGLEKGQLLAHRQIVITLLEKRFGPVSEKLREHVEGVGLDALRQLIVRVTEADSLADAGLSQFAE
jgi:hypothetical protein